MHCNKLDISIIFSDVPRSKHSQLQCCFRISVQRSLEYTSNKYDKTRQLYSPKYIFYWIYGFNFSNGQYNAVPWSVRQWHHINALAVKFYAFEIRTYIMHEQYLNTNFTCLCLLKLGRSDKLLRHCFIDVYILNQHFKARLKIDKSIKHFCIIQT